MRSRNGKRQGSKSEVKNAKLCSLKPRITESGAQNVNHRVYNFLELDGLQGSNLRHHQVMLGGEEFFRPKKPQFNYITDLFTRCYQSYFYFCATYACPYPDAISPTFESRFARMGYHGQDRFSLAYMRHTGKWNEIFFDLSLEECLKAIREEPHFLP